MPLALEIVSPEKLLVSRPVDMVVIPGSEGDIGALPGHAPMITMLRGGVVSLYEGDQITSRLFVTGGFAEITPERCTVLADSALSVAEIDRPAAEAALATAESAFKAVGASDMAGTAKAMEDLQVATARVEALR